MKIDEYNLYDKSATNSWELADEKWSSNDDTKFADPNKCEKEMKGLSHTTEKNLIQSGIRGKNYELKEEEILVKDIGNNSDLALNSISDQIDFPKKEPGPSIQRLQRN